MAIPDVAVRASAVAVAVLMMATGVSMLPGPDAETRFLEAQIWVRGEDRYVEGEPITLADLAGPAPQGAWGNRLGEPMLVLKLERHLVDDPLAIDVPGEPQHVLLGFHGKSTHLGCRVKLMPDVHDVDGNGHPDGIILDVCHHAQYDPYASGAHNPSTPGDGDLDGMELRLDGETVLFGQRVARR